MFRWASYLAGFTASYFFFGVGRFALCAAAVATAVVSIVVIEYGRAYLRARLNRWMPDFAARQERFRGVVDVDRIVNAFAKLEYLRSIPAWVRMLAFGL